MDDEARRRIAHIFQSYGLVSLLTAAENVEIALRSAGRTPKEARRLAADALASVALIIATHDTEVADRCDRTIRLAAGRIA